MKHQRMWMRSGLAAAAAQLLTATSGLAQSATMEVIGPLPRATFIVSAVSPDGSMLLGSALFDAPSHEAAYWTDATGLVRLGDLTPQGNPSTFARAASADGSVIVGKGFNGTHSRAFRWTEATGLVELPIPPEWENDPNISTFANGITLDGETIFGYSGRLGLGSVTFATFWDAGGGRTVNHRWEGVDISGDGTVVTGTGENGNGSSEAWVWTVGAPAVRYLGRVPGSTTWYSRPVAISRDGSTIIGGFQAPAPAGHVLQHMPRSFLWRDGAGMTDVGTPEPGMEVWSITLTDVSADGSVAVGWANCNSVECAVTTNVPLIWDQDNGLRWFNDVLRDEYGFDPGDVTIISLRAVSDDGMTLAGLAQINGRGVAVQIRLDSGCYADCDGSLVLDVFDFLCFQDLFSAGDPAANCDGSGGLDVFDFLCFQDAFATGCP